MMPDLTDHWWWRPGWSVGRRFYAWHLTFQDQPDVHRVAAAYRDALADIPALDPVPDEWLHLTMQGVGFAEDVRAEDRETMVRTAARNLREIEPFTLEFERPVITSEAIRWDLASDGPAQVRSRIRGAIREVFGSASEPESGFVAHVSVAYANRAAPSAPVAEALSTVEVSPAIARIQAASLILMHRDRRMYEWETAARVPLGTTDPP